MADSAQSLAGDAAARPSLADDLLIGAEVIAAFVYGDETRTRDIYRNVLALPLFRHGAKIAATRSGLIAAIRAQEAAAREQLIAPQPARKEPKPSSPPRSRRASETAV